MSEENRIQSGEVVYLVMSMWGNDGDEKYGEFIAPVFRSLRELRKHYPEPIKYIGVTQD